jgi:hypothetical protein
MATVIPETQQGDPAARGIEPEHLRGAHREVLLAVQRGLAAHWEVDCPRIAIIEQNGIATVYVSTAGTVEPAVRTDIRGAVRAALAEYVALAPYTNVVFLRRLVP